MSTASPPWARPPKPVASTAAFEAAAKEAARQMRRLPADLRRAIANRSRDEVAAPLAQEIAQAWTGPHAAVLAAATKARAGADPQLVIGGARRVVSGGASARQLVYGDEFGGGKRVATIQATNTRRRHKRRTTQQFPREGQHAVFGTIEARIGRVLDGFAAIIDDVLGEVSDG